MTYIPKPEEISSGICKCGCSRTTEIAKVTRRDRQHFRGYPMPYIHGHTRERKGANSHKWKGGRWTHKSGYVYVYTPEHPAANHDGYVLEHRLIMEAKLGRYLMAFEDVHHINGIRDDNRPENLVALTKREHGFLHSDHLPLPSKEQNSKAGKLGAASRWHKK